jgi:hypothetical protein
LKLSKFKFSKSEFVKVEICQSLNLSKFKFFKVWICQSLNWSKFLKDNFWHFACKLSMKSFGRHCSKLSWLQWLQNQHLPISQPNNLIHFSPFNLKTISTKKLHNPTKLTTFHFSYQNLKNIMFHLSLYFCEISTYPISISTKSRLVKETTNVIIWTIE